MTPGSFPNFTDAQVSALEALYPARCIRGNERLEDHLWYAGKVELIALLRQNVIGDTTTRLDLTADEDEAIALEVEARAVLQQQGET